MKIYISADIEGVTGIGHWNEATSESPFANQMTREVQAACEGANEACAAEIWIQDAHDSGRNITFADLPNNIRLIRSFSGHPFCMMQELDQSFTAALMIGYHAYAGSDENPLAHTLDTDLFSIKINGEYASEFLINAYTAALVDVPVPFVSGDAGLCQHVKAINPHITTVATTIGVGQSVISMHPTEICARIRLGVESCLQGDLGKCKIKLPQQFTVELTYVNHTQAYKAAFYPGIQKISERSLLFETNDYFEVLRMLSFIA